MISNIYDSSTDSVGPQWNFEFDGFELDPQRGELRRDGDLVPIAPQPLMALIVLLSNAQKLVLRETLEKAIWGELSHVDVGDTLNHCIARLRKALDDCARKPRYIATVPRMGYRFVGEVFRRQKALTYSTSNFGWAEEKKDLLLEIASVRSNISRLTGFSTAVTAVLVRYLYSDFGESIRIIDRSNCRSSIQPLQEPYRFHAWIQDRSKYLRVQCHLTEPMFHSVIECSVFDVEIEELTDADEIVVKDIIRHLLRPFLEKSRPRESWVNRAGGNHGHS